MNVFTNRLSQFVSGPLAVTEIIEGLTPKVQTFKAREDIISAGRETGMLFIVLSGWAVRYRVIEDGRRQILNFMLPGDIFDLQALGDLEADHSVAALETVEAAVFDAKRFINVLRESGSAATAFWWAAVQEESILREQIVRIGQLSARERICHLLLELQRRLSAALGAETTSMKLPVTRTDIGDALGLTSVHVSRTLSALKRMGLIEEDKTSLRIVRRDEMVQLSKFDPDYLHISKLDLGAELLVLPAGAD